jgi:hypothetical protein
MIAIRFPAARLAMIAAIAAGGFACSSGQGTPTGAAGSGAGGTGNSSAGRGGSASSGTAGTSSGGMTGLGSAGVGAGGSSSGGSAGSGGGLDAGAAAAGGSSGAGAAGGVAGSGTSGASGAAGHGNGGSGANGGAAGAASAGIAGKGGGVTGAAGTTAGAGFVDLFNGVDLTGFNVYRANSSANNAASTLLSGADAQAVFKPENGTIHVYGDAPDQSAQVHYLLQTIASYGKYNLSWEYKWGTKKFAPYTNLTQYPRDAGLLWHIHGDKTQVWPSSIEFQNKWGSTGDIYALYAQCRSLGSPNDATQFAEAADGGKDVLVNGANGLVQHARSANFELPGVGPNASTGVGSDWNTCLLQVDGGTAVYTVNGHVVNRVSRVMDKNGKDVTSGPVAWQAEQAEVYYRNLRIQVLP